MATTNKINKFLKFRFSLRNRVKIYKKLRDYILEEFPVYDSLVKFKTRYDKKKDFRGKIITAWLEELKKGSSFSKAIEGWIPDSELNLISSGETGKGLDLGLQEAIKFAISAQKIKNTIIAGVSYPAILFLLVITFVALFSTQIAPPYLRYLPIEKWPEFGQYFYAISAFVVKYWTLLLLAFIGIAFVIGATINKWTGKLREFFDKLPPWSIYKVYQGSSFLISLASMMQSGVPLNDALKKIKAASSPWLNYYIDEILKNLKRGGKYFGPHLNVGLLDEETADDVIDYSELGNFEQAIYRIGENNLEESVVLIGNRMGIVKNIMLVLAGITISLIYYTNFEVNTMVADAATNGTQSIMKNK